MSARTNPKLLVKGAGLLTSLFSDIEKCVYEREGNEEDLHRPTTPAGVWIPDAIAAQILLGRLEWESVLLNPFYSLSQTIEQLVAAGKLNDPFLRMETFDKLAKLPNVGDDRVNVALYELPEDASIQHVYKRLRSLNLMPAGHQARPLLEWLRKHSALMFTHEVLDIGTLWFIDGEWHLAGVAPKGDKWKFFISRITTHHNNDREPLLDALFRKGTQLLVSR